MNKILKFPQEREPFDQFLDELQIAYDENRLKEFICIYEAEYPEGKEKKGFIASIDKYWFGESSTKCLGLCILMQQDVLDHIAEKNTECNE